MNKHWLKGIVVAACAGVLSLPAWAAAPAQVATLTMPASVTGRFDHLGLDTAGGRLFVTAESAHEVLVFDLHSGQFLRAITGIEIPHAVLYRADLNRLYVTDGGAGEVRIYNGTTFAPLGTVKLKVDSDSVTYNPQTHLLYVVNGGGDAHQTFSMVSVVDTTKDVKAADISIKGSTVEQLALDPASNRLYAANPSESEVAVIDRTTNKVIAHWPVTEGRQGVSVALDPTTHRLYVGCRSGVIVVFDTQTGKQLQALKIAGGIDDLVFNPKTRELYATCGTGTLYVYQEESANQYREVAAVASARGAKNAVFDEASGRLYTTVPPAGGQPGRVLVYQMTN